MSELRLPPHIEMRQGLYWNTLSGRWVGGHSIQVVCDAYWRLQEAQKQSGTVVQSNGAVAYKTKHAAKPVKVDKRRREFKKQSEVTDIEQDYGIVPNPHAGEQFDEIFPDVPAYVEEGLITPNSGELEMNEYVKGRPERIKALMAQWDDLKENFDNLVKKHQVKDETGPPKNGEMMLKNEVFDEKEVISGPPVESDFTQDMAGEEKEIAENAHLKENVTMRIGDYWRYRGFTDANFYVLKKQGLIKFSDETQLYVDVVETDRILDERKAKKRVKTGGIKKPRLPIIEVLKEESIMDDKLIVNDLDKQIISKKAELDKTVKDLEAVVAVTSIFDHIKYKIPLSGGKHAEIHLPQNFNKKDIGALKMWTDILDFITDKD